MTKVTKDSGLVSGPLGLRLDGLTSRQVDGLFGLLELEHFAHKEVATFEHRCGNMSRRPKSIDEAYARSEYFGAMRTIRLCEALKLLLEWGHVLARLKPSAKPKRKKPR